MILVTNDDGAKAKGIQVLAKALSSLDEVCIVAPERERSAIGMAITLHKPLRVQQLSERVYTVSGTPVDCVHIAVGAILSEHPKLLISGINAEENLGQDVHYSGTVAAAIKGSFIGIPSLAVSIERAPEIQFETAADIAFRVARAVLRNGLPDKVLLNINVPNVPLSEVSGIEITRQDQETYEPKVFIRKDPRGRNYYWITGDRGLAEDRTGTDIEAVENKKVSITPIKPDFTDYEAKSKLEKWEI